MWQTTAFAVATNQTMPAPEKHGLFSCTQTSLARRNWRIKHLVRQARRVMPWLDPWYERCSSMYRRYCHWDTLEKSGQLPWTATT
jgi:hypothetical protein